MITVVQKTVNKINNTKTISINDAKTSDYILRCRKLILPPTSITPFSINMTKDFFFAHDFVRQKKIVLALLKTDLNRGIRS